MGKKGPCYHCGVKSTPLWRNGPPEKPILCNAFGSRWRSKGTLEQFPGKPKIERESVSSASVEPPKLMFRPKLLLVMMWRMLRAIALSLYDDDDDGEGEVSPYRFKHSRSDSQEEEDDDGDMSSNMTSAVCGIIPQICLRSSFGLLNPVPSVRLQAQRAVSEMSAAVREGNDPVTGHVISTTIGGKNGKMLGNWGISSHQEVVALCPNNNEVHIYQSTQDQWERLHVLQKHDQIVSGIDWSSKSNKIVTVSHDRNSYVWSLEGGIWVPTLVILRLNRAALCVQWSPKEDMKSYSSLYDDDDGSDGNFLEANDRLSRTETFFYNCSNVSGVEGHGLLVEQFGTLSSDRQTQELMMGRFLLAAKALTSETTLPHLAKKPPKPQEPPRQEKGEISPYQFKHSHSDEQEEEEEEDGDMTSSMASGVCGIIHQICLRSSFVLLNQVPSVRLQAQKAVSVRRMRSKYQDSTT
ncbi:unnamed protein product [Cochlearia groenlandica]